MQELKIGKKDTGSRWTEENGNLSAWQGSYTVEAAAVIPLVFLVLAALLICAFYVHDSGVFQSMACEAGAVGSNFITEKERQKAVKEMRAQAKVSRFLGSRGISAAVSAGEQAVDASYQASYPVPGIVMRYLNRNRLSIRKSWHTDILDPAKTIWLVRGVKQLIDGGTK